MGGDLAPARGATTFLSHATYHLSMVSVLATKLIWCMTSAVLLIPS